MDYVRINLLSSLAHYVKLFIGRLCGAHVLVRDERRFMVGYVCVVLFFLFANLMQCFFFREH